MGEWYKNHDDKYIDRDAWITGMREMIDMLENNPDLPLPRYSQTFNVDVTVSRTLRNEDTGEWETEYDALEMKHDYKRIAKALMKAGSVENFDKHVPAADGGEWESFRVTRKFNGAVEYIVRMERSNVCQRVKVGTREIPAEPAKWVEAKPARKEDVYEYECADDLISILK